MVKENNNHEFWAMSGEDALNKTESSIFGLTQQEAEKRLSENGKNTFEAEKRRSFIGKIVAQMSDKMIIILLFAAFISFATSYYSGEKDFDWVTILVIVGVNSIIGAFQERKAERAMEALKRITAPEAFVLRDGKKTKINSENIVKGDIVFIEKGCVVPADIRLITGEFINVDESSLTGEALGTEKEPLYICESNTHISDMKNMLWSGCPVLSGNGRGVVTATGINSRVGEIANALSKTEKEKTPLQKKLASVSTLLGNGALMICAIIFVFSLMKHLPKAEMFLTSVSLAVAAIPEGLPAIVTVVLSLGMQRMAKKKAVVKSLPAVETLGCAEIICTDKTGTITKNKMTVVEERGDVEMIHKISVLCNDFSSPTEIALLEKAESCGVGRNILEGCKRVSQIPFNSSEKYMVTVHKMKSSYFVSIKGAPEAVERFCGIPFPGDEKKMAEKSLRVMAFAYCEAKSKPDLKKIQNMEFTFAGLSGIKDPLKEGVKEAIERCRMAGIKTVMITGDHPDTARAIAKEAGFPSPVVYTEKQLLALSEKEAEREILKGNVFARVTPEFKVRVVKAYKKAGFTVAMTGDGVNDAPALKASDIGCAMGISGTEVAKEAADIVLADDNFVTVVDAVEEGRGIYENIRKSVHFLLSCNIGEILVVLCAILSSLPSPLAAIQLLWVNLVTDSLPAIALGMERSSKDIMKKRPIKQKEGIFSNGMGFGIMFGGVVIGALSLSAYIIGANIGGHFMGRTMSFAVLSLSQLFHSFNMREGPVFSNIYLVLSFAVCGLLQLSVILVPSLRSVFKTVPLGKREWWIVMLLSASTLIIGKVCKALKRSKC